MPDRMLSDVSNDIKFFGASMLIDESNAVLVVRASSDKLFMIINYRNGCSGS